MDSNDLSQEFIEDIKPVNLVVDKMLPIKKEDTSVDFVDDKGYHVYLTIHEETKYKNELVVNESCSETKWNGFSKKFIEHVKSARVVVDNLKCKKCEAVFYTTREYFLHRTAHQQQMKCGNQEERFMKRYSCDRCNEKFVQKSTLDTHMTVHDPFPHDCACGVGFYLKSDLLMHKELVHQEQYTEEFDKLISEQQAIRDEYMALEHNTPKFSCDFCGKLFKARHNMENHRRIHTGVKPYVCQHCGKAFCDQSARKRHERIHTGVKPYACSFCDMSFSDISGRISHERRHAATKNFYCRTCGKNFNRADTLRKHELSVHSFEKSFECDSCSKCFSLKQYLIIHIQRQHPVVKNPIFDCDKCSYRTNVKENLAKHIMKIHMNIPKKYSCEDCGWGFHAKRALQHHRDAKHLHVNKYVCDVCGARFSIRMNVFRHILNKHMDIKCTDCLKPFCSKSDLEKHKSKGCLVCHICHKKFPSNKGLQSHIIAHTSKKNFVCEICFKKFRTARSMKRHQIHIHNEEKILGI